MLLSKPEPTYDFAFKMFDIRHDGVVTYVFFVFLFVRLFVCCLLFFLWLKISKKCDTWPIFARLCAHFRRFSPFFFFSFSFFLYFIFSAFIIFPKKINK
jgi:hypothetical protein